MQALAEKWDIRRQRVVDGVAYEVIRGFRAAGYALGCLAGLAGASVCFYNSLSAPTLSALIVQATASTAALYGCIVGYTHAKQTVRRAVGLCYFYQAYNSEIVRLITWAIANPHISLADEEAKSAVQRFTDIDECCGVAQGDIVITAEPEVINELQAALQSSDPQLAKKLWWAQMLLKLLRLFWLL